MSMDRRGFFGRLLGAAVVAPVVTKELAKAAPGIGDSPAFDIRNVCPVPRGVPCDGRTFAITFRLPVSPPDSIVLRDLDWRPEDQQRALEAFDERWAELHGECLLEGPSVERGGFGSRGK